MILNCSLSQSLRAASPPLHECGCWQFRGDLTRRLTRSSSLSAQECFSEGSRERVRLVICALSSFSPSFALFFFFPFLLCRLSRNQGDTAKSILPKLYPHVAFYLLSPYPLVLTPLLYHFLLSFTRLQSGSSATANAAAAVVPVTRRRLLPAFFV